MRGPRRAIPSWAPWAAVALAAGAAALLPGELGPAAARGALATAALGALAALRRRAPVRGPPPIRIAARAALSRDGSVALVEVDGRRLLVGSGPGGARLLAELSPGSPEGGR